jgi:hypothetical protein
MGVGRALAVIVVAFVAMGVPMVVTVIMRMGMFVVVMMVVAMGVRMTVLMVMAMPMFMFMLVLMPLDTGLALTAAANGTHHSTSNSLIRISSPPVTCSW